MGFSWLASLIVAAWAFFVLGRKYQDFSDLMLARRISKMLEQRSIIAHEKRAWDEEIEAEFVANKNTGLLKKINKDRRFKL